MKLVISTLVLAFSFCASADVGDKYTVYGKSNRISMSTMLLEIVGVTVLADHDENPATAPVAVKAALDLMATGPSDEAFSLLGKSRDYKLTIGLVYSPDDVVKNAECLGKDFIYTDVNDNWGNGKTCYSFTAKDLIIK